MEETWIWSLVWEDPTCCQTTKPTGHNYLVCALEPWNHGCWAHALNCVLWSLCPAGEATAMRSLHKERKSSPCSLQLEKSLYAEKHPAWPQIDFKNIFPFHKKRIRAQTKQYWVADIGFPRWLIEFESADTPSGFYPVCWGSFHGWWRWKHGTPWGHRDNRFHLRS